MANIYRGLASQYYDLEKPSPGKDEFERILSYCQIANGPILEVMCGSGRILIPLLEQGFSVEGLDSSPFMLQACQKKLKEKGLSTQIYLQSLPEMETDKKYDFIFVACQSIGLIQKALLPKALKVIYHHLSPGGFFLLDVWGVPDVPPLTVIRTKDERKLNQQSSIIAEKVYRYDPSRQVFALTETYQLNGCEEEERMDIQLYEQAELATLLNQAGFNIIKKTKEGKFSNNYLCFECIKKV